ncbi:MAG: 16S rRNA (adenine(1518)-N(6)/adenine(1519)-N(6))-dimethyltransferase RsmA [Verrucomicrobiota bacterium]
MTLAQIKKFLEKKNLCPLKHLGQNFLIDENICLQIVSYLKTPIKEAVYEIGPGLGVLTEHLINQGRKITAFELDMGYCRHLANLFSRDQLTVVHGDVMNTLVEHPAPQGLIGNLPYNITTPLLLEIGKFSDLPKELVITIQKEVGDRLLACQNTKDYGATTVFLQHLFRITIKRTLTPDVFYPQPKVQSAILRLERKEPYPSQEQRSKFHHFVKIGFSQRRKKLRNTLNIPLDERPQHIDVKDWWQLFLKYRSSL